MKPILVFTVMVAALVSASGPRVLAQSAPSSDADVYAKATGQLLVKFVPEAMPSLDSIKTGSSGNLETGLTALDSILEQAGARSLSPAMMQPTDVLDPRGEWGFDRLFVIEPAEGMDIRALEQMFEASPLVEYATPVIEYTSTLVPNDPMFSANWGLENRVQLGALSLPCDVCGTLTIGHCGPGIGQFGFDSHLPNAWNVTFGYGDPSVVIAIIDDGVDVDHPDLRIVPGYDFIDNDSNPDAVPSADPAQNYGAHGTGCAGIAAARANNGIGITGVAGDCSVMPLRANTDVAVMNCLNWAVAHGADVISMSFEFTNAHYGDFPHVDAALQAAYNAGIPLLAASGNANLSAFFTPADHPAVWAIGAASPCGERKAPTSCDGEGWGSNYGRATQDAADAIDFMAPTIMPATDIVGPAGLCANGDYFPMFNGTSAATPFAAGIVALLREIYPTWTPAQLKARLAQTARDMDVAGWDRFTGYGLLDAGAALALPDYLHSPLAAGWGDAVVPRPTSDATSSSAPLPTYLTGDTSPTYFSAAVLNAGAGWAQSACAGNFRRDGVDYSLFGVGWPVLPQGGRSFVLNIAATVPGGRHTIDGLVDANNVLLEQYESNNAHGRQWVWTPVALTHDVAVVRPDPPNPIGGWGSVVGPVYSNVDGLRTPDLIWSGNDGFLSVAAVTPGTGSDVDLSVYPVSTGPQDGFVSWQDYSFQTGTSTDLIVIDLWPNSGGSPGRRDLGVSLSSGSSSGYTAQTTSSLYHGDAVPASFGPYTIPAGQIVRDFERFDLGTPHPRIRLRNLSGNADLVLAVVIRNGTGYYSRAELTEADAAGPGGDESLLLPLAAGGTYYGVVVFKKGAAEIAKSSTFELRYEDPAASDAPEIAAAGVERTGLQSILPSPFSMRTSIHFDLAREQAVNLGVYNAGGQLVRELTSSRQPAGRHQVSWNGRDDAGRSVSSGVYFVRLTAEDASEVRRIIRVR